MALEQPGDLLEGAELDQHGRFIDTLRHGVSLLVVM
jgi:hypothetical protein